MSSNTQQQIIRQSSLKAAIEWANGQGTKYSLTEIIGITMGFEEYCTSGSYETIQKVEAKLKSK